MKELLKSNKFKWGLVIVVTLLTLLIPESETFHFQVKLFLASTLFNILLLAFSLTHPIVPSILLPMSYWILNISTPQVIFGAWSNQITWVLLGGLLFADMMTSSGISKRIAYNCMKLARGNFILLMFIMLVPGIIIAAFVPAVVARCALFASIMMSLCEALDYKAGSKKAVIAFAVGYIVSSNTGWLFYTGSNANIIAMGALTSININVDFSRFLLCNFVPELFWLIGSVIIVIFLYRDKQKSDSKVVKAYIDEQCKNLGKMTSSEIKMAIIMIVVIVLLFTSSYHSLNPGQIFCLAAIVGLLPAIGLLDGKSIQKTNFTMVFLVAGCVAIGDVASELGAGAVLIDSLLPYAPHSFVPLNLFIWLITFIGNFLMTPLALIASLSTPIVNLAQALGFSPEAMMYLFLFSTSCIALPYEITASLLLFGYGMMSMKDFFKIFMIISIWTAICIIVLMIPWFTIIGLI